MRLLLLSLVLALGLAMPAFAQYSMNSPKGYKLSPPAAGQALGLPASDPLRQSAQACSGITVDGMFRVEPGMSRFFELDRGGSKPQVHEYALTTAKPGKAGAAPPKYAIDGNPVYIAFGIVDSEGYPDCVVASFSGDASGVSELDRFTLGAEYCGGVYALDLTGDGVTDLAVPYATGAGGGGGIEVRSVVPTGGLAWFGNDELDSTLFSQTGYINLLDYDGDGDWELETSAPVLCSACGYMWSDLYTFDSEANNWEIDAAQFPAYYKPQQDFYRQLNGAVQKLAANPGSMAYSGKAIEAKYATQIGGHWCQLDAFMNEGKVDKTWVSQLAALVDGWK